MLGILAGSKRYAHIAGIRGDAVAAQALGMDGVVSEDSVRRGLKAMELAASQTWMRQSLMDSVRDTLDRPWVVDLDATVKPLYGHQEGAEVGYNPHKPGRPSRVCTPCRIGKLRLVLDAVLTTGKQHASGHAKAPLKRLIERLIEREDWGRAGEATQGWQAIEDRIRSSGWSKARRVVVLRRRIKQDIAATARRDDAQLVLALPHDSVEDNAQMWKYTVLVTSAEYDIAAIGQLYRDRCDCENGFDELKNQWGWGGFTTHEMHRSQMTARTVALVCNWWNWYVRAANPNALREALTSRPLLLAAVGRATSHSDQTTLYLTPMHAEAGLIKSMIANVHAAIRYVRHAAEQLPKIDRWATQPGYICQRIIGQTALPIPPPALAGQGQLLSLWDEADSGLRLELAVM